VSPTRRDFLSTAAAAVAASTLGATSASALATVRTVDASPTRVPKPLRILILGGTGFIGPHQVRYAVDRGHHVTVFNRGRRQTELPKSVEHLQGDRAVTQLDSLKTGRWDIVIDNSATNPKWVHESAQLLANRAGRYMYVSSTGVFLPYLQPQIDESVQPRLADDPPTETKSYGVLKSLCEREAELAFPGRAYIVRPHYIVGPGDTTDRFPYWPQRLARGGEVLVPGRPSDLVQLIDVRDLTEWMIRLAEDGAPGRYNAAGPHSPLTMAECLYGAHAVMTSDVRWTWVDDYDFLAERKIEEVVPWVLLRGENLYMTSIDSSKAQAAGLTYRPLAVTVKDALDWWNSSAVPPERKAKPRFEFTPEREATILAEWHARAQR
jgi:2'-hydroxyisoflavone reductase